MADANLELVFGPTREAAERNRICRQSFETFTLTLLDLFWFSRFTASRYRRYVVVGDEMRRVLGLNPLIGVTGHLGNWEILSMMFGMEGNPMTAVAMPLKNPFVDKMLFRLRSQSGSIAVAREGAVRSLLRSLRNGGVVGLLLDQNTLPKEGGIFVPFFGLPVTVSNAAGLLGRKTKAPIVVAASFADAKGVYHFRVSDTLDPDGLDPEVITREVTLRLEKIVRTYPGYWLWSYKRWRYYQVEDDAKAFPFYASRLN